MKRYKDLILKEEESIKKILLTNFFIKEFEGKTSSIEGIEKLFSKIKRVESSIERIDVKTNLSNLKVNLNQSNKLALNFEDENINATSKGKFKSLFLNEFNLSNHIEFLIKKGKRDLAIKRIQETIKEFEENEYLFRMIYNKNENVYNLRSIASKNYKIYDNQFCLYLFLTNLEKLILKEQTNYSLDNIRYGESSFMLSLKEKKIYEIGNFKVYFNLVAKNSEIKDETFKINLKYTVFDKTGKSFSGMTDSLVNIKHNTKLETVLNNIEKLNEMEKKKHITLDFISDLNMIDEITPYILGDICNQLLQSNDFSDNEIKNRIKSFKSKVFFEGHYKIISGLNKLQQLAEGYMIDDELIFEQIIHKELLKILKTRKK